MSRITVSCSPDADDLFMMRALLEGLVPTGQYTFDISTSPTDGLNKLASGDGPDVVAISVAHYPHVSHRYLMLPHGGSMGEGYGPVVIAPSPMRISELADKRIAVPGLSTSAYTTLRLMTDFQPVVVSITPYSRIFEVLRAGEVDAGLIIHEGRLTFEQEGFHQVADIGEWWAQQTNGMPLPLGANAIKRSLGDSVIADVSALLKASIAYALQHREETIAWLLSQGGALKTPEQVSQYLHMYANQRTLDYGSAGRDAIRSFFEKAYLAGVLPEVSVEFSA